MSTVMDTVFPAANAAAGSIQNSAPDTVLVPALDLPATIREGDWQAYLDCIAARHGRTNPYGDAGALPDYKRQCAFAYLGKRAQKQGGVYSKKPRILSPETIVRLGESNRTKRYARYPWIEKLLKLMAEIERLQEENIGSQNVFSLVHPVRNN